MYVFSLYEIMVNFVESRSFKTSRNISNNSKHRAREKLSEAYTKKLNQVENNIVDLSFLLPIWTYTCLNRISSMTKFHKTKV